MGWLDSLVSAGSSVFGGGGSGGFDFGNTFDVTGGVSSGVLDAASSPGFWGTAGGALQGLLDFNGSPIPGTTDAGGNYVVDGVTATAGGAKLPPVTSLIPQTSGTPAVTPANIQSNVPGLTPSPSGGLLGPTGGGIPGVPTTPIQPQTAGPSSTGGNATGTMTGGMDLTKLLGAIPALSSLFNKPTLGPEAAKLQAMADQNQSLVSNQIMPTALANQQGLINDQALNRINDSMQRQKAGMRKAYADMGMSGSTMEQQDLAALDAGAAQQVFETGQQMATTGLSTAATMTGQDAGIYQNLMDQQLALDKEYRDALAEFAAAAVAPSAQTQVNVGGGGSGTQPASVQSNVPGLTPSPTGGLLTGPLDTSTALTPATMPQTFPAVPDYAAGLDLSGMDLSTLVPQWQSSGYEF